METEEKENMETEENENMETAENENMEAEENMAVDENIGVDENNGVDENKEIEEEQMVQVRIRAWKRKPQETLGISLGASNTCLYFVGLGLFASLNPTHSLL